MPEGYFSSHPSRSGPLTSSLKGHLGDFPLMINSVLCPLFDKDDYFYFTVWTLMHLLNHFLSEFA